MWDSENSFKSMVQTNKYKITMVRYRIAWVHILRTYSNAMLVSLFANVFAFCCVKKNEVADPTYFAKLTMNKRFP